MAVYDLLFKFEGLKALCGGGMADEHISSLLFPAHDVTEKRSRLSRIKSGELPLLPEHKARLSEDFNARIAANVLRAGNSMDGGPLRAEDWDRPLHELFGHLAAKLEEPAPAALDRAHAGILEALLAFGQRRERDDALLAERYDSATAERTRMPESAEPVDPLELPLVYLRAGDPMALALQREVTSKPARCWLFYVRNPDRRQASSIMERVWDQSLSQLVFWHKGGPFDLPAHFVGDLPGFPTATRKLTGTITAFLLVEPLNSFAVADFLAEPNPGWDRVSPPSFEGVAHMVTCSMRLFQVGNTRKHSKGDLSYEPPKLYVRPYQVIS